eukprot:1142261-Pelagomonas_calceolata.AAC.2
MSTPTVTIARHALQRTPEKSTLLQSSESFLSINDSTLEQRGNFLIKENNKRNPGSSRKMWRDANDPHLSAQWGWRPPGTRTWCTPVSKDTGSKDMG